MSALEVIATLGKRLMAEMKQIKLVQYIFFFQIKIIAPHHAPPDIANMKTFIVVKFSSLPIQIT